MATRRFTFIASALLATLLATGCGGGSDAEPPVLPPDPVEPPPDPVEPPTGLSFEVLAGLPSVDFENCESSNGAAAEARFSHLLRISVYEDAAYLAETGEGCSNISYRWPGFEPENLHPNIRQISDGTVETAVSLHSYVTMMSHPTMVRYPSGVHRKPGSDETFVLGYVAAASEWGFALDQDEVARYTEQGGWSYYIPGLFRFTQPRASYTDLVAGVPNQSPAQVDGIGQAAGFVAPHDLEVDAAGLFYVIDDGHIRTIDADYEVRTLDHAALGITGTIKALDADHQGNIHVLAQRSVGRYTWHRLSNGSSVDFQIGSGMSFPGTRTRETFTVVGDAMVLGTGHASSGSGRTQLYRVSDTGQVTELTGRTAPGTPQDFLDQPAQYWLPQVQHIEYGVDGHLYVVLPQGVLIARDFALE